jgi:hypothetical protein
MLNVVLVKLPMVGILNLSPHLCKCNSAILRTTKSIAELQTKKSCRTAIAGLENLTSAIPQLSTVSCQFRYFLVPFPQLRMVLKITPIYLELFVSLETKTCLKGTVAQGFLLPIFFS